MDDLYPEIMKAGDFNYISKIRYFAVLIFSLLAMTAWGQQGAIPDTVLRCNFGIPPMPHGDRARAVAARHGAYTGNTFIAQLGYIDSVRATIQEIWDNFEVGLTVLPSAGYKIVSYNIGFMPKGRDFEGPYDVAGDTISFSTLDRLRVQWIKPGDQICFDNIRIQKEGSNYTLPLKGFKVVAK